MYKVDPMSPYAHRAENSPQQLTLSPSQSLPMDVFLQFSATPSLGMDLCSYML